MHRVVQFFENDNTLNGYCVVNAEGRFARVNSRCCEVLGYSEEQLLNLNFQAITHPQDLKSDVNSYLRVMDPNDPLTHYTMEKRYIHGRTNQDIWAVLNVQGYYDEHGQFEFFLSEIAIASDRRLSAEDRRRLQEIKLGLDNKEFIFHYQPIVELSTGATVGYEALSRWQHKGETLSPLEFIPLLQVSHSIHLLCHSVIQLAAKVTESMNGQWLSVNISPLTIARDDWAQYADLFPRSAHMEILESDVIGQVVIEKLREIRERGVVLALDDFGSGYSNFKRLSIYGIEAIKIDASIVQGLPDKPSTAMCGAIIAMAQVLGLKVIAEGIETQEQAEKLLSMGCDMGQGYYFGKPAPIEEINRCPLPVA